MLRCFAHRSRGIQTRMPPHREQPPCGAYAAQTAKIALAFAFAITLNCRTYPRAGERRGIPYAAIGKILTVVGELFGARLAANYSPQQNALRPLRVAGPYIEGGGSRDAASPRQLITRLSRGPVDTRVSSDHSPARRRVLVVDDNADFARLLGEFIRADSALEFVGYVCSGAEAIEKAHSGAADVLLLDLSLRDVSGFQVLERLRKDSPAVKVIVHTGHAFDGLGDALKSRGAAGYVVKDGNPDALLSAIRAL